ncbi:hypothetical protein CNR22_07565 [Sphingobacteriaceae bacterium]|nr:hypothetical protein CNR22_07565 [Sphingobacteriaceae bacterium]
MNSGNGYVTITKLSGVNIILSTPISCNGQSNAALTASVFGTTGPYTYSWSPGGSSSVTITGLGPGTYTCRATDAASITYINTFTVTDPPLFTATTTQTNVSCYGYWNGLAWLHISGGTGPYSFTWSPSTVLSSAPLVGGLAPGSYTCDVKDFHNCAASGTFVITQPAPISLSIVASNSVLCSGESLTLTATGVQNYTWTSGPSANGVPFTPSVTETYLVIGEDAAGCSDVSWIDITVNPGPTVTIISTNTACPGNSVDLNANGASTYAWSTLSTSNNITVSPTLTSVYSVTGTATNGCTDVATKTITLLNNTTVTANTSSMTICEGKSVTLTGSGASTYTWSNGVINNVAFSPTATSVYSVTGTGACGTASAVITVTVNPLPSVTANATNTLVCTGSTVALSGVGASTYSWSGGISNNTAFPINATSSYTGTGTDANGCQNIAVKTISTNPLPVVSAFVSAATVCAGSSVTLNGGGANSYTWTSGVSNNTPFAPAATGSYTVTGTDVNGCQNSASVTVSIINAPLVSANSTSTSVCFGNTVSLNGSGALTYTWTGTVSNNVAFTPTVTSTYTVFGSNACFTASNVITVTVNALPVVAANASGTLVCQGATLNLSGSGALSYTWSNAVSNNLPFAASNTATYTVTGTDANGCQNTANKVITVNPLPVVSLSATSLAICAGASISLNASGADTYTLTPGTLSTPLYPNSNTLYSLVGSNTLTGCSSTNNAVQSVTVNTLPVLSVSASSNAVCMNQSVVLTAQGANTYTWTNGVMNGIPFSPTTTATYSVQGTNTLTGCANSVSQQITVHPLPSLSVSVSNATVCSGSTVVLTASGADSYSWTPTVVNGVPFTPTVSNGYVVMATNSLTGCFLMAAQIIIVDPLPVVTSSVSDLAICKGNTVTVFAQGADTYTFSNGITNGVPFTPQSTLNYSITGTNSLTGCTSTNLAVQTITVNALPTLNVVASQSAICSGESLSLTVAGAATYSWNTNETSSTIVVMPVTNSTFNVVGVDANGCSGQFSVVLDVADCVGLSHQTKNSELNIFPNPNNGEFYISGDFAMNLSIINELGQIVRSIQMTGSAETINLKGLENGIYFVIGQQGNQLIKHKVVVAR